MSDEKNPGGVLQHVTGHKKNGKISSLRKNYITALENCQYFFRKFSESSAVLAERKATVSRMKQVADEIEAQGYVAAAWYFRREAGIISIGGHRRKGRNA